METIMNRLTEHFLAATATTFTPADVRVELSGSSHSLNGLLKRAAADGDIVRIRRGLYCLAPEFRKKPVNVYTVAQHVYGPGYISLETALSYHGWIMEGVFSCMSVCLKTSKEFTTPTGVYSYTRVPQEILYMGVDRGTDAHGNTYLMAKPEKALADYVYVHKKEWKDLGQAALDLRIEEEDLNSVSKDSLAALLGNYRSRRVRSFLKLWLES
jgi:hypothetical protein